MGSKEWEEAVQVSDMPFDITLTGEYRVRLGRPRTPTNHRFDESENSPHEPVSGEGWVPGKDEAPAGPRPRPRPTLVRDMVGEVSVLQARQPHVYRRVESVQKRDVPLKVLPPHLVTPELVTVTPPPPTVGPRRPSPPSPVRRAVRAGPGAGRASRASNPRRGLRRVGRVDRPGRGRVSGGTGGGGR